MIGYIGMISKKRSRRVRQLRARAKRRKDGGEATVQIPCKHLQWICELFKRLNSLKNLVCTGAVCHRRHPLLSLPYVTLYIERLVAFLTTTDATRSLVLFLSLPLFSADLRLLLSVSLSLAPPAGLSLGSVTLCISNN